MTTYLLTWLAVSVVLFVIIPAIGALRNRKGE